MFLVVVVVRRYGWLVVGSVVAFSAGFLQKSYARLVMCMLILQEFSQPGLSLGALTSHLRKSRAMGVKAPVDPIPLAIQMKASRIDGVIRVIYHSWYISLVDSNILKNSHQILP